MASISMKMERGTGVYGISESEERGGGLRPGRMKYEYK